VLAAVLSCSSTAALADLYMWVDERGTTVLSNVMPASPRKVRNFEVVVKEEAKPAASKPVADTYQRSTTEKLLLDRIESLEREIKAQQSRETHAVAAPPPEMHYMPRSDYTADLFYPGYPGYPSYVFPYPPGAFWGYPPSTVVVGSTFGFPHRGFRGFRSVHSGHVVSHPVSHPVSIPVSVPASVPIPAGRPVVVSVRR
jgi:hypothetical protein